MIMTEREDSPPDRFTGVVLVLRLCACQVCGVPGGSSAVLPLKEQLPPSPLPQSPKCSRWAESRPEPVQAPGETRSAHSKRSSSEHEGLIVSAGGSDGEDRIIHSWCIAQAASPLLMKHLNGKSHTFYHMLRALGGQPAGDQPTPAGWPRPAGVLRLPRRILPGDGDGAAAVRLAIAAAEVLLCASRHRIRSASCSCGANGQSL